MFNTLKRFFGRRGGATIDAQEEYPQFTPPPGAVPVSRSTRPAAARSVRVDAQPAPVMRPPSNAPSSLGVPLKSVIARLPADLMQRVRQLDVGEAEIFIPMQKVLSQISSGAVRLSFGELRQIAPPGTFTPENDRDRALVELPLHEVLARLNPGLLSRRPAQKHVEVPPEVTGPFGGQTKVTFSTAPLKPAPPARPDRAMPAAQPLLRGQPSPVARPQPFTVPIQPVPRVQSQPSVVPGQPVFARIRPQTSAPLAAPVSPIAPAVAAPVAEAPVAEAPFNEAPVFTRRSPVAPQAPVRPVYSPIAPQPPAVHSGDTEVIHMPEAFTQLPPAAPISPIAPVAEPEPAPIRFAAAPVQAPAFTPAPAPAPAPVPDAYSAPSGETRFVSVSLAELSQSWPEALRQEITLQNLSGMTVGLPFGAVEGVIKTGKIAFPWKALRNWIKSPAPAYVSAYDTTLLDLPLKVVTPLFLAELKATRAQRKVSMDEAIPDLFFDSRVPEAVAAALSAPPVPPAAAVPVRPVAPPAAAPAPVAPVPPAPQPLPAFPAAAQTPNAKPADTNYFVWKEKSQPQAGEIEETAGNEPASPGTAFLNRYATPNEIVSKAATLEGVDGALIALPDGLLVASRIPPNMNADTIAAFLPQIFGRVSQCTRELRLGELNNLNFTVGNIPWKIFRVGAIYFAAFGRPGVPLPTAQLVGLAAELDRKAK